MHCPRPTQRPVRFAACLLSMVALCLTTISDAKIYRWVDADGVVQYSDQPPPDRSADTVKIRGARSTQDGATETPPEPGQALPTTTEKKSQPLQQQPQVSPEQQAAIDAAREENCRRAQSNLTFLQNNPPNRLLDTDDNGNVYRLTVEDHTARMQKASDAITENCDQ